VVGSEIISLIPWVVGKISKGVDQSLTVNGSEVISLKSWMDGEIAIRVDQSLGLNGSEVVCISSMVDVMSKGVDESLAINISDVDRMETCEVSEIVRKG